MNTYSPKFKLKQFKKRLVFDCPNCGKQLDTGNEIECQCGAEYELILKEKVKPISNLEGPQ